MRFQARVVVLLVSLCAGLLTRPAWDHGPLDGDWQVNGVLAAYQGRPFSVGASGAALNAPGNSQTADQVKPKVEKPGGIGPGQFFYDPSALTPGE